MNFRRSNLIWLSPARWLVIMAWLAPLFFMRGTSAEACINLGSQQIIAVGTGTATFQWSVVCSTDFYVQASTNASFVPVYATSITLNTFVAFAGLQANSTFYFSVSSTTFVTQNVASTVTLPMSPGALALSGVGLSSTTANWNDGGNPHPSTLLYDVEASTSFFPNSNSGNVNTNTSSLTQVFGTGGVGSPLSANTTHFFQVRANNITGPSSWTSLGSTSTLARAPLASGLWSRTDTVIVTTWGANGNPAGTLYRVEVSSFSPFTVSTFTVTSLTTATFGPGLVGNNTYYFRTAAISNNGIATAFVTGEDILTLPAPPGVGSPSISSVNMSSVAVSWTSGGNGQQSLLTYSLEVSTSAFPNANAGNHAISTALTSESVGGPSQPPPLSLNTTYFFEVAGVNSGGTGSFTNLGSTATLATAPASAAPSAVTQTTLQANWGSNGNPAGTLYRVELSSKTPFSLLASSQTVNTSAVFSGLLVQTTYYLQVFAINHNAVPTAVTVLPSTVTLVSSTPLPGNVQWTAVNVSSVSLSWTLDNPAQERPLAVLSSDAGFTQIVSSATGAVGQSAASYNSLTPNTAYFFKVKVSTAPDSAYSIPISTLTLPAPPATAAGFGSVTETSLTVDWSSGTVAAGFNPVATLYELQLSADAAFAPPILSTVTASLSGNFSGLASYATYYAQVRAVGQAGALSPFVSLGSTTTLLYTSSATQTISLDAGRVEIQVPANVFSGDYSLRASTNPIQSPLDPAGTPAKIIQANDKLAAVGQDPFALIVPQGFLELDVIDAAGQTQSLTPGTGIVISISLPSQNGLVGGSSPPVRYSSLHLYRLDENDHVWVRLPTSQADPASGKVSAVVYDVGVFALIGEIDTSLGKILIYPVPFRPTAGHTAIKFINLSQIATIRIFTLSGNLVQTLREEDGDGQLSWDVRDAHGDNLPSGVYYYLIESATDRKRGKLMVIR